MDKIVQKETNLAIRIEQLEQMMENLNNKAESGYLSLPSTESSQKLKISSDLLSEDLSDITEEIEYFYTNPRLFMALKDHYDPGNLSFQSGQLIRILGHTSDPDFLLAESGGIKGLCPSHLVTEVVQSQNQAQRETTVNALIQDAILI